MRQFAVANLLMAILFLFGCAHTQVKPAADATGVPAEKAEKAEKAENVAKPSLETVTLAVEGMS